METMKNTSTVWLQSDHRVSSMNAVMAKHLPALEHALRQGVAAVPDAKRPEFYELQIGDAWYYLHVPARIPGVFLISCAA